MIEFDHSKHEYSIDGKVVPSVTQILSAEGLIDTNFFKPGGASRGEVIHGLTAALDKGVIKLQDLLQHDYYPYLKAWEKFKKESGISFEHIEHKIFHERMEYAGTVDRLAILSSKPCILDIKTGVKQHWHGIQLAGYNMVYNNQRDMYGVYLDKTCNYKLEKYDNPKYRYIWESALNLYKWRVANGLCMAKKDATWDHSEDWPCTRDLF